MRIETGQLLSEFLAEYIKQYTEASERVMALEGTGYASLETISRLLRRTQVVTSSNKVIVEKLLKIAAENANKTHLKTQEITESILNQ